jgi:hypothetical protein
MDAQLGHLNESEKEKETLDELNILMMDEKVWTWMKMV